MQDDWKRLRLVTRQFVICYSEDGEEKEEKSRKHSSEFFSEKDYKRFYWFNKNEGLLHCQSFICPMSQKGKKDGIRDENERLCMMIPFAR